MKNTLIHGKATEYINNGTVYSVKVRKTGYLIRPSTGDGFMVVEGTVMQDGGNVRLVMLATKGNNQSIGNVLGSGNFELSRLDGTVVHVLFGRNGGSGDEFVRFYQEGVDGYIGEVRN